METVKTKKGILIASCILFGIALLIMLVFLVAMGISLKMIFSGSAVGLFSGIVFLAYFIIIALLGLPVTIAAFICSIITIGSSVKSYKITAIILTVINSMQLTVYGLVILRILAEIVKNR
jgi:hypothetical protein